MQLNGDEVFINDRVFDISAQRGYGIVVRITNTHFEVKYERYSVMYDEQGYQMGKPWQTVFWEKPLIVNPAKGEQNWAVRRQIVDDFFKIVKQYKDFV